MPFGNATEVIRKEEWGRLYRKNNATAERWARGYGAIRHTLETQARIFAMAEILAARSVRGDGVSFFDLLHGADRITSMAMWLAVYEPYTRNVYLDGRELLPADFKATPEGHTAGTEIVERGGCNYEAKGRGRRIFCKDGVREEKEDRG
jgi:hypothetical protein